MSQEYSADERAVLRSVLIRGPCIFLTFEDDKTINKNVSCNH